MRVGIVSAAMPLGEDDATAMGEGLEAALRAAGHDVELVLLPFAGAPGAQLVQRAAYRSMEFAAHYDLLVTLRTPAEIVRHPRKVAWLASDPFAPGSGATLPGRALAAACARASLTGLREARRVLAASEHVAERLRVAGVGARILPALRWDQAAREVVA